MTNTSALNMPIFFTMMLNLIVFGFLFVVVLVCCFLLFDLLISGPGSMLLPRFLSNVALSISVFIAVDATDAVIGVTQAR